jgi:hypothetical protein
VGGGHGCGRERSLTPLRPLFSTLSCSTLWLASVGGRATLSPRYLRISGAFDSSCSTSLRRRLTSLKAPLGACCKLVRFPSEGARIPICISADHSRTKWYPVTTASCCALFLTSLGDNGSGRSAAKIGSIETGTSLCLEQSLS